MQSKVFICHSSNDHDFVEKLANKLKQDGIDVWIDDWMINVGDSITQKINDALQESSFFIIIFSENSIESEWVNKELNATLMRQLIKKDMKILPVLLGIDKEQLPPLLMDIYFVKFNNGILDEKEYAKLIRPIKEKSRGELLKQYQDEFFKTAELIDSVLKKAKPSKYEIELILKVINEEQYYYYFFNKVNTFIWFDILKLEGYFNPGLALGPKEVKDNHYIIPLWDVLPYLERLSQSLQDPANEKYINELLDIIKNVTAYHIENKYKIDNYRTWWYFIKILVNIPNDKIIIYLNRYKINIGRDWVKEWITSKFDSMLPASDLVTKLLPKFLTEKQEDINIVEQILDVITDIKEDFFDDEKAIQKIGLFEKRKDPKTKVDSYWLIKFFEENKQKIGMLCSEKIIFNLANKLKEIFDKKHGDHQVLIELEDNVTYRISVKRIKEFNFEISLEQLQQKEINALNPEDRYFGVLKVKGNVQEGFPFEINECRNKKAFIEEIKKKKEFSKWSALIKMPADALDKKIANLYQGLYSDYSSIWCKSLYTRQDIGVHNADELLTFILKDLLSAKCKFDTKIGKSILDNLLSDQYQYPLFRRFALFVINYNWKDYRKFFWKFIEIIEEPFDESDFEVELFKLLQQNVMNFTLEEKEIINSLIDKGPRWLPDEEQKQEHYIARWKQKWYSAMMKDDYFLKFFEVQKNITKLKEIEPPEEQAIFTQVGEGPSPLTKEDILKMDNVDLVEYLNEFRTQDRWKGPTEEGLAEVLKAAVKEDPNKFVEKLELFSNVRYIYIYNILYGLEDAWKEKNSLKSFNWGKLFKFIKDYINKPNFIEEGKKAQGEDWHSYHIWIINVVGDLIQEGTQDDSWAFSEDYFNQAEELINIALELLEKLPQKEKQTHKDFVTEALNTSYGRVIMAMIFFALRKARVEDKKGAKKTPKWSPSVYESLLQKGIIEAYTYFGRSLPNFAYLNREWIKNKIIEFESLQASDIKWQAFMEGYLFGSRVYQDLYKLMRNHYIKGIESDFPADLVENRLVQHITIGYLRGNETIEEESSLFKMIINNWKYSQINTIIDFFWSQARYLKEELKQETEEDKKAKSRIIEFWRWVYKERDTIKNKLKDDYKKLLSDLSRLTLLLDNINPENYNWLFITAPFVGIDFDSNFFIEYLDKFEDPQSVNFISKIFLEMLSTSTPNFPEEHIKSIVSKIYKSGNKIDADKICNIYGSRGREFLRTIYEEHNKI